jgi:hypothetical protein
MTRFYGYRRSHSAQSTRTAICRVNFRKDRLNLGALLQNVASTLYSVEDTHIVVEVNYGAEIIIIIVLRPGPGSHKRQRLGPQ